MFLEFLVDLEKLQKTYKFIILKQICILVISVKVRSKYSLWTCIHFNSDADGAGSTDASSKMVSTQHNITQ